jgi:hypothetical protein
MNRGYLSRDISPARVIVAIRYCRRQCSGMAMTLEPGDVIQIELGHKWALCLAQVDEVRSWGVIAYVMIPRNDGVMTFPAYIRLTTEDFRPLGVKAPLR